MGKLTSIERKVNNANLNRGSSVAVDRIRGRHLMKIRERIAIRDEYVCQICRRVTADGEVDHKQPLHLGGRESDENRWWLCPGCHEEKSEREKVDRGA